MRVTATQAAQVGETDKTKEVVTDAAIGAVVGAAVGAAGGAIAGGGKGAGKGAAIGGSRRGGRQDALRAQREQEERREVPGRLLELHALARLHRIASRPSSEAVSTLDRKEGVVM